MLDPYPLNKASSTTISMWTVTTTLRAVASIASIASAFAASTPPSGAITVGGTSGKYSTIAAAIADTSSNVYFIYAVSPNIVS